MIEPMLVPRESFDDPDAAVERVRLLYQTGVDHLRRHLQEFVAGRTPAAHVRACYPGVRVHTDTVTVLLRQQQEPVDRFVLLDHLDWMDGRDPVALEEEWTELRRCAQPGARVLFRSAHRQPPFLRTLRVGPRREPVGVWLDFRTELAEDLHRRDRVHTYASFHVAEVRHG